MHARPRPIPLVVPPRPVVSWHTSSPRPSDRTVHRKMIAGRRPGDALSRLRFGSLPEITPMVVSVCPRSGVTAGSVVHPTGWSVLRSGTSTAAPCRVVSPDRRWRMDTRGRRRTRPGSPGRARAPVRGRPADERRVQWARRSCGCTHARSPVPSTTSPCSTPSAGWRIAAG
ncbi:hypothetical protein ACFPM0_10235 [Pseudonocardia sulfidoxydans]|uniref:hypothetical protein n=1 Tax=Pseudonocardia sulfidoxydans TaxID=54011 RepID=UPI00360B6DBD